MPVAFPPSVPAADGLFPSGPVEESGWLEVGDGHSLYWETSGQPEGIPVVYLHGGPGAGCAPLHRRFFDPARYRIVLFDQRGCGRSRPYAGLEANTTSHLVADLEALREHLEIDAWLVFGGSWGSTLALAYGQQHRSRVLGMILRGIFLFRPQEVDWFLSGMMAFCPEAHEQLRQALPPGLRPSPLARPGQETGWASDGQPLLEAFYRLLTDPDPAVHMPAAKAWTTCEDSCCRLLPLPPAALAAPVNLAMARIEAHYMMHRGFLDRPLLEGMAALHGLPCTIVQGRYDMICPPRSAWELHRAWPGSRLRMIADGGHSALEPSIRQALVQAVDLFAPG